MERSDGRLPETSNRRVPTQSQNACSAIHATPSTHRVTSSGNAGSIPPWSIFQASGQEPDNTSKALEGSADSGSNANSARGR
jgi:hypothetical protein